MVDLLVITDLNLTRLEVMVIIALAKSLIYINSLVFLIVKACCFPNIRGIYELVSLQYS